MNFKLFVFFTIFIYGISCDNTIMVYNEALKSCGAQYKLSTKHPNEAEYFLEHGEFPAGKEQPKCFFECVVKKVDMLDSSSNFDKTKLKAIAEANPSNRLFQFVVTENPLEKCPPAINAPSVCDLIFGIVKCVIDLHNARKVRSATMEVDLISKLRKW